MTVDLYSKAVRRVIRADRQLNGSYALSSEYEKIVGKAAGGIFKETIECAPDLTAAAAAYNKKLMNTVLGDLDASGGEIFIKGGGYFTDGFVTYSRIMLTGESENGPIYFRPTIPGTPFFKWSRRRYDSNGNVVYPNPSGNSELSLEASGAENITIIGNRQQFANGFVMTGLDHGWLRDCSVRGIRGTSLNMQHVREYNMDGFVTRFCAHCDPASPVNNIPDVILGGSELVGFEAGNLSRFKNLQITFSLGPSLLIDSAFRNRLVDFMIHMTAPTNLSLEQIMVNQFGGGLGWDASGDPMNELSRLMVGAPNLPSIAGRRMSRGFAACYALRFVGPNPDTSRPEDQGTRNTSIDNGDIVGSSGPVLVEVDGPRVGLEVGLVDANSSSAAIFNVSRIPGTNTFQVDGVIGGLCEYLPEAGSVVEYQDGTIAAASPFLYGMKGYLIRLSDSTFQIAETRAQAISEVPTPIVLTSNGDTIKMRMGGALYSAVNGAFISGVGRLGQINNGRRPFDADELSVVSPEPIHGVTWVDGPSLPSGHSEQKLFVAKRVDLNKAHTDFPFRKIFTGNRYVITRYAVVRTSGGATVNNASFSVFLGPGETIGTILANARLYGLAAQDQTALIDAPNPAVSVSFGGPGTGAGATVQYDRLTGIVSGITVTNGGTGYTTAPVVTVSGVNGVLAQATVSGGIVTGVTLLGAADVAGGTGFVRSASRNTSLYAVPQNPAGSTIIADIFIYGRVVD